MPSQITYQGRYDKDTTATQRRLRHARVYLIYVTYAVTIIWFHPGTMVTQVRLLSIELLWRTMYWHARAAGDV